MKKDQQGPESRSIIELSSDEARDFLFRHENYCKIDLPLYFNFDCLIRNVNQILESNCLSGMRKQSPHTLDCVNYSMLNNKDGRYAWRPLEIVHPALYISLVNKMTEQDYWEQILQQFQEFACDSRIQCLSLPVELLTKESDVAEQEIKWWRDIEQKSIELSLDFEYINHTDIVNCYADIYTHSIAWALHSKSEAKAKRWDKTLIGNIIDDFIKDMRNGQTNGIPQGSVLMDFIAEMVLGFADTELSVKIDSEGIKSFRILRYRDDYRIFVNNPQDGERILKCLTEVMIDLGLKLKPEKTKASSEVIRSSIEEDKLNWLFRKTKESILQKHLLIIHDHCMTHPDGGSLKPALHDFNERLQHVETCDFPLPLISIVVDIAYRSPHTYSISSMILSKLVSFLDTDSKRNVIERIRRKFLALPNTGHMEIWLQRFSLQHDREVDYREPLCRLARQENAKLWNNDWIGSKDLLNALDTRTVVDTEELKIAKTNSIIQPKEVPLYNPSYPW